MYKFFTLLVWFYFLSSPLFAQEERIPAFIKDSLDEYVNRGLRGWQIPGAAVCVVKDGKVVVMKGYGLKEHGTAETVDENTLFMIGSNTKAFTGTALAMLHSNKTLSLDDKVKKWLPDFKLYDPWVTREANLRDLLCHRLGFETFQGDFMFFDSDLSLKQVREKFGMIKPLHSFRGKWGYTNAAFMIAGEVIRSATKRSWAEFIRDSLFAPLEMKNSLALSEEIATARNKAIAHTVVNKEIRKIAYGRLGNMSPAGSISSSVNDLSHWLLALLDNGKYKGKQVIPNLAIGQTWLPHSILGNGGSMFNRGHFSLYGLGWFLEEYEGRKIVSHTGGVNGFVTAVTLVPEEKLGIIVFTNTDTNNFYEALKRELLDAYLRLPYRNYNKIFFDEYERHEQERIKMLQAKKDTINMKIATELPLIAYTGNYEHSIYGKMKIAFEKLKLVARFEHHKGREAILEPLGGNRFLATFNDPLFGIKVWPFTVENKKVRSVTVRVADFVEFTPYEFIKK